MVALDFTTSISHLHSCLFLPSSCYKGQWNYHEYLFFSLGTSRLRCFHSQKAFAKLLTIDNWRSFRAANSSNSKSFCFSKLWPSASATCAHSKRTFCKTPNDPQSINVKIWSIEISAIRKQFFWRANLYSFLWENHHGGTLDLRIKESLFSW